VSRVSDDTATRSLDPTLLATFLAVHRAGRISGASKVLHLSQPAVTAQIRRLEGALGVALFTRSVRGVAATEAGDRLARHAIEIERRVEQAIADVRGEAESERGELVVAASTTIAAHVLPPLFAGFRATRRDVGLRARVGNTEEVLEDVRDGRAPVGLVEGHARAAGVRLEPFIDDEIVLVTGRDASFKIRAARDLENVPLLVRESGSGTRSVVERALAKAGLGKRARTRDIELGSTEAILSGAIAGLGVAFVSRWSIRHLAPGLLREVAGLDLVVRRTFRWALPAGGLSGTAASFHAFAVRSAPVL
jgi:DNA-binding transcriptional LysR family regulator